MSSNSLAVEKLLTFVFEDYSPLPGTPLKLTDGLFLDAMPTILLNNDDEVSVQRIEPHFSQFFESHLHKTTLNVAFIGKRDANYEANDSLEAGEYAKIDRYLLATMLHTPRCPVPHACFVTVPSQQRICHSQRMKEYGMLDTTEQEKMGAGDFATIDGLYATLARIMPPDATGKIPTALRYYQQAFRTDIDPSMLFLGMMMGMEALFGQGTSQISHQVSERTAFLLREDAAGRENVYDWMRDAYDARSKIAHGGAVTIAKERARELDTLLLFALRDVLVKILIDPSLLTIFHSATSKNFAQAMKRLVFWGLPMLSATCATASIIATRLILL